MTTTTTDFQPGIYPDIPELDYHARQDGEAHPRGRLGHGRI